MVVDRLRHRIRCIRMFADARSVYVYLAAQYPPLRFGRAAHTLALRPRETRFPVMIRPTETDAGVFYYTFFHQYHRPPRGFAEPAVILDLGANIGLTMAHFASLYPRARVYGVEMDSRNVALCRLNTAGYGERCRVVEGAVWSEDGEVTYDATPGHEDAYSASELRPGANRGKVVAARSIATLLREFGIERVDLLKMDIEGAERRVLKEHTEWASRVCHLEVELHGEYSHAEAIADMSRLGFVARADGHHPRGVVGTRPAA